MTFVLTPLSHYNSITNPRARFLLSLLKDLSIDFPSHFIISIIDVYRDTTTCDKLIFPSAITRIIRHFSILIPDSPLYTVMGATNKLLFGRVRPSFDWSGREPRRQILQPLPFLPPPLFLLWQVMWLLRQSWHSFSAWMLALILSLLNCIRWTPVLVVLHDDRLTLVASLLLHLLL